MLEISEIVGMTAFAKAELFAKGARQMTVGRHSAAIALASLERSNGYRELGFKTVEDLAAKLGRLEDRDVTELLWVGRKLLDRSRVEPGLQGRAAQLDEGPIVGSAHQHGQRGGVDHEGDRDELEGSRAGHQQSPFGRRGTDAGAVPFPPRL